MGQKALQGPQKRETVVPVERKPKRKEGTQLTMEKKRGDVLYQEGGHPGITGEKKRTSAPAGGKRALCQKPKAFPCATKKSGGGRELYWGGVPLLEKTGVAFPNSPSQGSRKGLENPGRGDPISKAPIKPRKKKKKRKALIKW